MEKTDYSADIKKTVNEVRKGGSYFLNTIDWYIIKKILVTFLVADLLIVFIIIVIDLSTKIDDFIDHKAPVSKIIIDYYLNFIPYMVNMLGHLFFFISVVFITSRLTARSEVVAIFSSGISFHRFLRPFILSAVVVGLMSLYLSNFLIPQANVKRYEFEKVYYRNKFRNNMENIHIQTSDSVQVYVKRYDNVSNTGYNFTKEIFDGNRVKEKFSAEQINYDSVRNTWTMINFTKRQVCQENENLEEYFNNDSLIIDLEGLTPNDFNNILVADHLSFFQLNQAIERERMKGTTKVRDLMVEKYSRLFNPLAYIILTLIGVSLSCKKTRGGTGVHLAIGIALAFSLILVMKIFQSWAINGNLHPLLSPVIPIVIYTFVALFLLKKAPK